MFRELCDFVGIDINRVLFSWVSAAEGAKWADVVTQLSLKYVNSDHIPNIRRLLNIQSGRLPMDELRKRAKELLESKKVSVVIGYEEGTGDRIRALFVEKTGRCFQTDI